MLHSISRVCLFAALGGLLLMPAVAWGQGRTRRVHDEAKLFSADAIENANKVIARIKEKYKKDLYIETVVDAPPKDERAKWAKARCNDAGVDGVYLVIIKGKPLSYRYVVGDRTRENGYFTTYDMKQLDHLLKTNLAKSADETLMEVSNFTLERMSEHARTKGPTPQPKKGNVGGAERRPAPVAPHNAEDGMPSWVGWVCLIAGVLLVIWVVFAIIRGITGMMSGGYGGGYGGGGYGGGGGGGFLTGMLGGLFGGMAGMWMYNNFFGGHSNVSSGDWGGGHQGVSGTDAGAAPYEPDTDAGGGGGGDADGGGGDADGGDVGGGDAGDWGGGDVGGGDAGGGDAAGCGGGGCGGGGGGGCGGGGGD